MPDLRELYKRERRLLSTLSGVEKFVGSYEPNRDEAQISVRLQMLEATCKEFYDVHDQVALLLDTVGDKAATGEKAAADEAAKLKREEENEQALSDFENRYCIAKAGLLARQPPPASTSATSGIGQHGGHSDASFSKVKLPEIRLPSFDGKIKEWVTFRDSFRSLIHSNKQLTDMDRFSYLKSALSGEALQEIESVELSSANYSVAWKALESRYENKKLIVKAHLDYLFAVEGMKVESYDGLNNLVNGFEKNLQMLQKIGEQIDGWSTILAYMVYTRLDSATLRQWETHHNSKQVPTYENIISFLRNHCSVLQSVAPAKSNYSNQRLSKSSVCHATVKAPSKCPFCSESWHSAFVCGKFQRLQIPERYEAVFKARLCLNCLSPGHFARNCEKGVCHHCEQKHHSLLHGAPARSSVPQLQSNSPTEPRRQPQSNPNQQTPNDNTTTLASSQGQSTQSTATPPAINTATPSTSQTHIALPITPTQNILLSTALVKITDRHGNSMLARALLDSCSQHCLMTKEFSSKLQFHELPSYLSVQGVGSSTSTSTKLVTAVVRPRLDHISAFEQEISFYVLPRLTVSLPTTACNLSGWKVPESSSLADPHFYEPGPVDIIIGAEYYMDLLRSEQGKATEDGPTLQSTMLGWIVSGRVPEHIPSRCHSLSLVCSTIERQGQPTTSHDSAINRVGRSRNTAIKRRLTVISEPELDGIPQNRLSARQKQQQFTQQSDHQFRRKWTARRNNMMVGTMVVLKEKNQPPLKWLLGRVTEVHAGRDGNVRDVTVKTRYGSYRRGISRICVLPFRDNVNSPNGEN